jgi:hypothetical protein
VLALSPALLEMNRLWLRNMSRPAHNYVPVFVFTGYLFLKMTLNAVPLVRGQKLTIRQRCKAILVASNTGEPLYVAIPGG